MADDTSPSSHSSTSGYKSQSVGVVVLTYKAGPMAGPLIPSRLEKCLESVDWADKVCVMDDGSTDDILALAEKFTDHVYVLPDASVDARLRFGVQQLNTQWVLWIDPYQAVEELLQREIEGRITSSKLDAIAFDIPRKLMLPSGRIQKSPAAGESAQWIRHGGWYPRHQVRMFQVAHVAIENIGGQIHIQARGPIEKLDHAFLESPVTDLRELMTWFDRHSKQGAYAYLESGKTPDSNWVGLATRFKWQMFRRFVLLGGFHDGAAGLALAIGIGYSTVMKHLKLAELRG